MSSVPAREKNVEKLQKVQEKPPQAEPAAAVKEEVKQEPQQVEQPPASTGGYQLVLISFIKLGIFLFSVSASVFLLSQHVFPKLAVYRLSLYRIVCYSFMGAPFSFLIIITFVFKT